MCRILPELTPLADLEKVKRMLTKGKVNSDSLRLKEKYGELEFMEKHPVSFVQYAKVSLLLLSKLER